MSQFSDLARITELMLEKEMEAHRRNLDRTRQLDGELAQIDTMRRAAQADSGTIDARQMLGADTLWQGWLVRKRGDVLRQMAMARAHEANSLARARNAFSRAEAAKGLVKDEREKAVRKRLQADAEEMDALGTLRRALAQSDP